MKNEIEQIAQQNDMSIEFVTWFFNEKKANCGNVWFMMMAAMWEGWKGRSIEMDKLAAENVALSKDAQRYRFIRERDMFGSDNESGLLSWEELAELECNEFDDALDARINHPNTGFIELDAKLQARKTHATDRIVAGIKADGRVEGAHFVANRMLAAWDAGFIEDSAKNAADIARMILTSTEFMADAPEGDFDRSFADGILEDIAKQLREVADK
ncbi:hypothetical protein [Klebsiella variicola]|uniref:hypothetical protein n=1 Tax=Klebsiella variicola TaxID=244366 RepID=UPI001CCE0F4D|nr:hypothetical protein [Klebsiella variicola]